MLYRSLSQSCDSLGNSVRPLVAGSAVDAMVVATAIRLGGALIATADTHDLTALAQNHPNVKIWSL